MSPPCSLLLSLFVGAAVYVLLCHAPRAKMYLVIRRADEGLFKACDRKLFLRKSMVEIFRVFLVSFRVELTSGRWRSKQGHWFGEVPWQVGHLSLGLLVYLLPNMRHLELFIGVCAIPFMSLWWFLPESPRWLLSQGRTAEAMEVLRTVCRWNGRPCSNMVLSNIQEHVGTNKKGTMKGNNFGIRV